MNISIIDQSALNAWKFIEEKYNFAPSYGIRTKGEHMQILSLLKKEFHCKIKLIDNMPILDFNREKDKTAFLLRWS